MHSDAVHNLRTMSVIEIQNRPPESPKKELLTHRQQVNREIMERSASEWKSGAPISGLKMIEKLKGFHEQAVPTVNNAYSVLQAAVNRPELKLSEKAFDRLEPICSTLKEAPPLYGEEPDGELHPYLRHTTAPNSNEGPDAEPLSMYSIDEKAVRNDIKSLENMEKKLIEMHMTEEAKEVGVLISQLTAYRLLDVKTAVRDYMDTQIGKGSMDVVGKKMGRTALAGILGAGTAIFGTIAFVNFIRKGEISATPFLWAFATWFVAKPDLLDSVFGKDNEYKKDFDQIRSVTANKSLEPIAARYKIGGKSWRGVAERIYEHKLDELLALRSADEATVTEVVTELSAENEAIAGQLRKMIFSKNTRTNESDFERFAKVLARAESEEARTFIGDYIEHNCFTEGMRHEKASLPSS